MTAKNPNFPPSISLTPSFGLGSLSNSGSQPNKNSVGLTTKVSGSIWTRVNSSANSSDNNTSTSGSISTSFGTLGSGKGDAGNDKKIAKDADAKGKSSSANSRDKSDNVKSQEQSTQQSTDNAVQAGQVASQKIGTDAQRVTTLKAQSQQLTQQTVPIANKRAQDLQRLAELTGQSSGASSTPTATTGNSSNPGMADGAMGGASAQFDGTGEGVRSAYSFTTAAQASDMQQKGQINADGTKTGNSNAPAVQANKGAIGQGSNQQTAQGSDDQEVQRLQQQITQETQQINTLTTQRVAVDNQTQQAYNAGKQENVRQSNTLSQVNQQAQQTQDAAKIALEVANDANKIAHDVKTVGQATEAAGHGICAIPIVGPPIGTPVVTVGTTTKESGQTACTVTSVAAATANTANAAATGNLTALATSGVQLAQAAGNLDKAMSGASSGAGTAAGTAGDTAKGAAGDTAKGAASDTASTTASTATSAAGQATGGLKGLVNNVKTMANNVQNKVEGMEKSVDHATGGLISNASKLQAGIGAAQDLTSIGRQQGASNGQGNNTAAASNFAKKIMDTYQNTQDMKQAKDLYASVPDNLKASVKAQIKDSFLSQNIA